MRALLLALPLVACSVSDDEPSAPEEPKTFSIRQSDFWREEPRDICRSIDGNFLDDLMERVRTASSFGDAASFRDFNVTDARADGTRDAVLRIDVEGKGIFTIAGPFDTTSCDVGALMMYEGANVLADDAPVALD